jgi:23S rRNA pseudouridine1911/1915/1917 synthase
MPIKKVRLRATSPKRLDDALLEGLPEALGRAVSKAKVRKLIMAGAVYLNGRPVRVASKALFAGATIEAAIDVGKFFEDATSRDRKFELTVDRILYEDEDLIVIDKPPGIPAQPTLDEGRDNLFAAVGRFLSRRGRVAKPYVGVHQRLDRDTSGVVLFTKTQRLNAAVAEIFSQRRGVKIYQALTVPPSSSRRKLQKEWTIRNYLGKISSKGKRARYGAVAPPGDLAETSFRLIAEHPRGLHIEAIPKTGRTHQIRVHLSECGLPILGDDLYCPDDHPGCAEIAPRLMLHAARLIFPHPITTREISVESPLPTDFVQCLRRMESENCRAKGG